VPHTKHRLSWILIAALFLPSIAYAQGVPQTSSSPPTSPSDESALREVLDKYFAAYAREDLEEVMRLWSARSPELAPRREALQKFFKASDNIEVKSLMIRKVTAGAERASIRLAVETSAADAQTGKPSGGVGQLNRTLQFVKEDGAWKVWREVAAEEDLAAALVASKTPEERDALLAAEKELMTAELWRALIRQGTRQYLQSNYPHALTINQLALSVAEYIRDNEGIAQALNDNGAVQYKLGDFGLALEYLHRSLTLRRTLMNRLNIAVTLSNLGSVYGSQGNYSLSAEYFQKAVGEFESLELNRPMGALLNNIGNIYEAQGNNRMAIENYEKALKYFVASKDEEGAGVVFNNIGTAHQKQGDYGLALEYLQKSLKLKEASDNKAGIAASLHNIGEVYRSQGGYDLALDYFQKSLSKYETLGENSRFHAATLCSMGIVYYSLADYPKALDFSERAAAVAAKTDGREVLWEARTTAGRAYRALNKLVQARQAFEEAIATVEGLREWVAGGEQEQQRFFEGKTSPYHEMVGLLVAQDKPGDALPYAEQAKARVLLDVLRRGRVDVTKAMTSREREQEKKLNGELVWLNKQVTSEGQSAQPDHVRLAGLKAQLDKARLEYEAFRTSLYAAHPELKARRGEARTVTLGEAADMLPEAQSAVLEYVVTEEKTYLFVLTKGGRAKHGALSLRAHTLPIKRRELAEQVEGFRQQLAKRDLTFRASASRLYDLLLKPARAELEGKNQLVVVPDGVLWELPFQALQDAQRRYLVEDHSISYAPSLTVLREMANLRRRNPGATDAATLLAFGNPALEKQPVEQVNGGRRDDKLSPLPEAEKEVKTLAQLYGTERSKVYTGPAAREERLKAEAGSHRIIQLAAHAILNDASPMYSHVLLAQGATGANDDGLLEAWEMMNLDLRADLVVLSACETGLGRVAPGEGVIGMSWALFVAGSPTTVVSLWKVESTSTTELMLDFHRNLLSVGRASQSPPSKASALQRAAVKMLGSVNYRHPFYWAGFSVVGDGN
jgi:CHAT domain-containing protein/Tfp pilus assembly protein PilF